MNSRWTLILVLGWAAFIFATSSTVITADQLIGFVGKFVSRESLEKFALFWGITWFTIVKTWHVLEFAILTALLIAVLNRFRPPTRASNIAIAAGLALLYAASDEFHQTFVAHRGGTVRDVLIDSLGIGTVALIALARVRKRTLDNTESTSDDPPVDHLGEVVEKPAC